MSPEAKKEKCRAYLLKGDDELRKQQALEEILKPLISPDFADFDLEESSGDSATSDRVIAGLSVPPFGSSQRVVLVRYANKMLEEEQLKLASKLAGVPASGCLILVNPAAEKADGKPKRGSEVVGDLSKAIGKIGQVRDFPWMKADAAAGFARSIFAKAGKKIDARAVGIFIQRVGADSAVITSEAGKLIDYALDSDSITQEDVLAVTSETPEEKIFKLVDAVATRNQAAALRFLGELFDAGSDTGADAPKALATMARHFRLLWQMRLLQESGVRGFRKDDVPDNVKEALPADPNLLDVLGRQAWMADRLARQARPLSRSDIARCFAAIAGADLMLKGIEGGIEDPRLVMELLVSRMAKAQG